MKTKLYIISALLILCSLFRGTSVYAQDPEQYGTPFSGVPDSRDAVIYQVNMRCFSPTRDFKGVIDRLDNIKNLGVNVIYLMPVQPVGTLKAVNSPYCIKDLKAVNSEFGSLADLRALIDSAHSKGMAVILDWVANQTSWDHPWITEHKDWYQQDGSGNIISLNGWNDIAALNFSNTEMRDAMVDAMRYWVFASNCDGFRCDYANNNTGTFWTETINNLRGISSHKLLMFAEGDGAALYNAGFDYTFSWNFFGNMKNVTSGSAATIIDNSNTFDYNGASGNQQVVRWLSNHDIYGSDGSPYTIFGGKNSTLAAFAITAYMKSVPFIYNGMEVGNTAEMKFPFNTSLVNWQEDLSITPEMTNIIAFRNASNAIRRGTLTTFSNTDICAFKKVSDTDSAFVFINTRKSAKTFTLPAEIAGKTMYDAFTNKPIELGTSISLEANQYRVFTNSGVVVPATGLALSKEKDTMVSNASKQLAVYFSPSNATYQFTSWSSSDTNIVKVNSTGYVTGVAPGTTQIIAKTINAEIADTCYLTVTGEAVTGVTIDPKTTSLDAGSTKLLTATIDPENATYKKVIWISDNSDVATVNSAGLISGISPGSAKIIVKTLNEGKTDTCYVTITGTAVSGISLNSSAETLITGATKQLTFTILPNGASNKNVSWTSSDNTKATVSSNGLVTGIAVGSADIIATTADGKKTDTCKITVEKGGGFTVYFYKPATWTSSIKIYYWEPVPAGIIPAVNWPGLPMTAAGGGWFKYVYSGITFTNLIFNDGTKQTGNLARDKDGWYKDDVWYDTNPDGTAVNESNINNSMQVYPNPAENGQITIALKNVDSNTRFKLIDLQGRNIFESKLFSLENTLNISSVNKGMYIVEVSNARGSVAQKLIVK